jgi:hypothetical protein
MFAEESKNIQFFFNSFLNFIKSKKMCFWVDKIRHVKVGAGIGDGARARAERNVYGSATLIDRSPISTKNVWLCV